MGEKQTRQNEARRGAVTGADEAGADDALPADGTVRGTVRGGAGRERAAATTAARGGRARLAGVDAARGLALGVLLLLSRPAGRFLVPLAAMGSMTFTLYTAHLLFLWFELHTDAPQPWFWAQAAVFCGLALCWRRHVGRGPLEKVVSRVVRSVDRRALARDARQA